MVKKVYNLIRNFVYPPITYEEIQKEAQEMLDEVDRYDALYQKLETQYERRGSCITEK